MPDKLFQNLMLSYLYAVFKNAPFNPFMLLCPKMNMGF